MTESADVLIIAPQPPSYAHPGDAGADLRSAESLTLEPGQRSLVGTGVSIALPEGFAAFVVPRSGLAAKHGITVVNSPGTIDAGYRGEIKVILLNTDASEPYRIEAGDRIAQLIVDAGRPGHVHARRCPSRQRSRRGRLRLDRLQRTQDRSPVMILRRKKSDPALEHDDQTDAAVADDDAVDETEAEAAEEPDQTEKSAPADREQNGPLDEAEANPVQPFIDLGGVKVLPREGLNLRLEVEESSKRIVAVGLDYAGSTLQVQPFAAPRSRGLWHETREQIREQITKQGGTVEEVEGTFGPELRASVRSWRRRRLRKPGGSFHRGRRAALVPARRCRRSRSRRRRRRREAR